MQTAFCREFRLNNKRKNPSIRITVLREVSSLVSNSNYYYNQYIVLKKLKTEEIT